MSSGHALDTGVSELLHHCKGHPTRISLFDPIYRDRIGRYPGILADATDEYLCAECLDQPPWVPPGTAATLELVSDGKIIWCHTQVAQGDEKQAYRLRLEYPERLQSAQLRRHIRTDTNLPVHYVTKAGQTPSNAVIINLSAGGAALQGGESLEPGQIIALIFGLGSGLFFQDIRAEVLRTGRTRDGLWRSGLKFKDLSSEQEMELNEWVKRQASHSRWIG